MDRIGIKGRAFVDQHGRERIFHGLNLVYKGDRKNSRTNYIPPWDESLFLWMADHGFNVIRLGMIWDAVEPGPNAYSDSYLDWLDQMLHYCAKYSIYAYLDMHQDLYSHEFSDGAPGWATLTDGLPHQTGEIWSDSYLFSEAVKRCFDNFWTNRQVGNGLGLLDHYTNMWVMIARRFQHHQALLGFDFLNEPYPGEKGLYIFLSLLETYSQLIPGSCNVEQLLSSFSDADKKNAFLDSLRDQALYKKLVDTAKPLVAEFDNQTLVPFYQRLTAAVRKVCPEKIIMLENNYFSNMGIECGILSPIADELGNRVQQAYAPHGYDLVVDTPEVVSASNQRADVIFHAHRNVQNRLDIPVLVGEWGAHGLHARGLEHICHLLDTFDARRWSHTYWCYEQGLETAPVMQVLCRPYPHAVCGRIIDYGYDLENNVFTLTWNEQGSQSAESLVFLHCSPRRLKLEGDVTIREISSSSKGVYLIIKNEGKNNRQLTVAF